ncbi:NUDIX domain-containing protein [Streptomyces sparsogenes]|uniref:NUDIX domain-containing protein n=1 Tax=Streptomyces sparsogenes TaxID=67365 RepID=UPI0033177F3D
MVLLQHPGDGRVLTVRHQPYSWHSPGLLTVIGDRPESGEFFHEGTARELAEETRNPHRLGSARVLPAYPPASRRRGAGGGVVFLARTGRASRTTASRTPTASWSGLMPPARPSTATPPSTPSRVTSPPGAGTPASSPRNWRAGDDAG